MFTTYCCGYRHSVQSSVPLHTILLQSCDHKNYSSPLHNHGHTGSGQRCQQKAFVSLSSPFFSRGTEMGKITFYFPCGIQPSRLEATPHTELIFLSSCNRHLPSENTDSERLQDSTEQGHRNALTASYLPLWAFLPVKGHRDLVVTCTEQLCPAGT